MTNPSPWTATSSNNRTGPRFTGLDTALVLLMVVAGLMLVLGVIIAFFDESPDAFIVAGLGLTTMILTSLGRVVIHMAQTLDRIAADARDIRNVSKP